MYLGNYSYLPTTCSGGGDLPTSILQRWEYHMYVMVYLFYFLVCICECHVCVHMGVYVGLCMCAFMCEVRRLTSGVYLHHSLP